MMRLNRKDYRHIGIIFSIVFVWIAILFFFVNIYGNNLMEKMNNDMSVEQRQIDTVNDYVTVHGDLKSYQDKLNLNLQTLQEKIPDKNSSTEKLDDDFLAQLNQMAAVSKVQIIQLIPRKNDNTKNDETKNSEAEVNETYFAETISLSVQGDYFAVLGFLRQLNLSSRLVAVEQGKIYQLNESNSSIVCDLTLQIYTYLYN